LVRNLTPLIPLSWKERGKRFKRGKAPLKHPELRRVKEERILS